MTLAPIILFVYNRPRHTKQLLQSLAKNELIEESELFVFSDGARSEQDIPKIKEVRKLIEEISFCKQVKLVKSQRNNGLSKSIIYGVSEILKQYDRAIVLEDDLWLSSGFLKYVNDALELYKNDEEVMHVSGYLHPIGHDQNSTHFFNLANCWGWATWSRAWHKLSTDSVDLRKKLIDSKKYKYFNLEGGSDLANQLDCNIWGYNSTWAVKWHASIVLNEGLCLHPGMSLVRNTGFDGSGENSDCSDLFAEQKIIKEISVKRIEKQESQEIREKVKEFFLDNKSPLKRFLYKNYSHSSWVRWLFKQYIGLKR
jgi:glycosyl transferase family 2